MIPAGFLPSRPAAADGICRVLLVHAHPDDESIATGGSIAALSAAGVEVSLLTATRGELGEVIPAELKHLEQGRPESVPDGGAALAQLRSAELGQATAVLGVRQHFFLGEAPALDPATAPRSYRDSGMSWGADGRAQAAATVLPGSFSRTPLPEVAAHAAAAIRRQRPDVVITYAADGGYGHPDHVYTHQMTVAGIELAAAGADAEAAAWNVPVTYTILSDRPAEAHQQLAEMLWIDGDLTAKREAIRAHRTQAVVEENRFALSDLNFRPLSAREGFQLLRRAINRRTTNAPARSVDPAPGQIGRKGFSDWLGHTLSTMLAGVLVAVLGTMLHSRTSTIGDFTLPWGAILALVLLGSAIVLVRSWSRSTALGILLGIITYATCVIFSMPHGQVALILGDLSGGIWLYGIALVTLVLGALSALLARRSGKATQR